MLMRATSSEARAVLRAMRTVAASLTDADRATLIGAHAFVFRSSDTMDADALPPIAPAELAGALPDRGQRDRRPRRRSRRGHLAAAVPRRERRSDARRAVRALGDLPAGSFGRVFFVPLRHRADEAGGRHGRQARPAQVLDRLGARRRRGHGRLRTRLGLLGRRRRAARHDPRPLRRAAARPGGRRGDTMPPSYRPVQ